MDFQLSDEQLALRESTRGVLAAKSPLPVVRRLADSDAEFDAGLWRAGAELGWSALAVPEELGGLGQQVVDQALVAMEFGRALAPAPFLPIAVVIDALVAAPLRSGELLSALVAGRATAAWAFGEPGGSQSVDAFATTARRTAEGFVIDGRKTHVQDGGSAGWLLVDVLLHGEPARLVVPGDAPGVERRRERALDITRSLVDITFAEVAVPADALLSSGPDARAAIARSARVAATLATAELVGVGERMLELTVDYARARRQFDRAIGSFQAVQHKCADMRLDVQASTAALWDAAMAVSEGAPDADRAVSIAKSFASQAICRVGGNALQVHGGIGFTWEHDLHLYIRRARSNALLHGDARHHHELLCRAMEAAVPPSAVNTGAGRLDAVAR